MPLDDIKNKLIEGSRFINIDKSYEEVKLLFVGKKSKNDEELVVLEFNFPGPPSRELLVNYNNNIFPDLQDNRTVLNGRLLEIRKIYINSRNELKTFIYNGPNHRIEIDHVINFYLSNGCKSKLEAEALIKLAISKGALDVDKLSRGYFIRLSTLLQSNEDKKRFLHSIADEIVNKSDRIELLIKHNVSKGNYREMLFRDILKKYIPKKYEVVTGFIEGCARQCDVIIYDAHNFCPFFQEGDLVVVPEKAVRAVIEVKTSLDSNSLKNSIDLLAEISRNRNFPAPFFKAIFAFKIGIKTEKNIAGLISKFYNRKNKETGIDNELLYLYEAINAVCVLNEQCLISDVIDYTHKDLSIQPRIYKVISNIDDIKVYSTAFFNELFSYLDVDKYAKRTNINFFRELDRNTQYHLITEIYDENWFPQLRFENEHSCDTQSLWKRISDVLNWKSGRYRIQDLEEVYFSKSYLPEDHLKKISNSHVWQPSFSSLSKNSGVPDVKL